MEKNCGNHRARSSQKNQVLKVVFRKTYGFMLEKGVFILFYRSKISLFFFSLSRTWRGELPQRLIISIILEIFSPIFYRTVWCNGSKIARIVQCQEQNENWKRITKLTKRLALILNFSEKKSPIISKNLLWFVFSIFFWSNIFESFERSRTGCWTCFSNQKKQRKATTDPVCLWLKKHKERKKKAHENEKKTQKHEETKPSRILASKATNNKCLVIFF